MQIAERCYELPSVDSEDSQSQFKPESKESDVEYVKPMTIPQIILCLLVLLTALFILEEVLAQCPRFVWDSGSSSNQSTVEQGHSKWSTSSTNFDHGDVLLLVDETTPRYRWKIARVISINIADDQLVRGARVKMKTQNKHSRNELDRHIHDRIQLVISGSIPRQ